MKQKQKVILLEVKFESTINGVIKETAHDGNDGPTDVQNSWCVARETQWRRAYWHKEEKWLWQKGCSCPRGNDTRKKKFTLKEFSVTFHNIESIYDKMLEADLN